MMKSYEEMAREEDEDFDGGRELEGSVRVEATVAKEPRVVTSIRLSPDEHGELYAAARRKGLTLSDFIREAAKSAARGDLDLTSPKKAAAIVRLRELSTEYTTLVRQLTDDPEVPASLTPRRRQVKKIASS